MIWPHDNNDAVGASTPGVNSRAIQATVRYTAAWGWSQKTLALSQSSA